MDRELADARTAAAAHRGQAELLATAAGHAQRLDAWAGLLYGDADQVPAGQILEELATRTAALRGGADARLALGRAGATGGPSLPALLDLQVQQELAALTSHRRDALASGPDVPEAPSTHSAPSALDAS